MTDFSQTDSDVKLSVSEVKEIIEAGNRLAELLEDPRPPDTATRERAIGYWEAVAFQIARRA